MNIIEQRYRLNTWRRDCVLRKIVTRWTRRYNHYI